MKMEPPPGIVRFVRAVTPPADREHVLGDLEERFQRRGLDARPLTYLADSAQTIPLVMWSRARRVAITQRFALQAVFLAAAFAAVVFRTSGAADTAPTRAFAFLFLSMPALTILLLVDVYASTRGRSAAAQPLFAAAALTASWTGGVMAAWAGWPWAVGMDVLTRACTIGFMLVSWLRFAWVFNDCDFDVTGALSETQRDLVSSARRFHEVVRRRHYAAHAVCIGMIAVFASVGARAPGALDRVGAAAAIAAAMFLMFQVWRFRPSSIPANLDERGARAFLTGAIRAQQAFHGRRALFARLAMLVPGPLLLFIAHAVRGRMTPSGLFGQAAFFIVALGFAVTLNQRAARRYERQLEMLDQPS